LNEDISTTKKKKERDPTQKYCHVWDTALPGGEGQGQEKRVSVFGRGRRKGEPSGDVIMEDLVYKRDRDGVESLIMGHPCTLSAVRFSLDVHSGCGIEGPE
jgi:hypothetical protein